MIKTKPICALISSIICQCIVGSMFFYISFTPYRYSQILSNTPMSKSNSMMFIFPLSFCFFCGIRLLGLYMNEKLGPRMYINTYVTLLYL